MQKPYLVGFRMNFKEKIDAGLDGIDNVMEFMKNQPKKRCGMIEGHDNYWEGKIEEIKKVVDDYDKLREKNLMRDTVKDFEEALDEIKKILEK